MKKYFVLKKEKDNTELLEVIEAKNLTEARRISTSKHLDIILSGTSQLVVVGKSGYEQYYK